MGCGPLRKTKEKKSYPETAESGCFWRMEVDQNNVDNDTLRVDSVRLGVVSAPANGTRGTVYFDGFVSQRDGYIGLDPDGPSLEMTTNKYSVPDNTLGNHLAALSNALLARDRQVSCEYDPLGRLRAADYANGIYFHYTYDAVGNRLTETTPVGTTTYTYDDANRLATVNKVAYTWDDNGNLLSDGTST